MNESKKSNGGPILDSFVDGVKRLLIVAPVSALTLPFQIAYNQMSTIFVFQGNAMRTVATVFNSSFMSNLIASVFWLLAQLLVPFCIQHWKSEVFDLALPPRSLLERFLVLCQCSWQLLSRVRFITHTLRRMALKFLFFGKFLAIVSLVLVRSLLFLHVMKQHSPLRPKSKRHLYLQSNCL